MTPLDVLSKRIAVTSLWDFCNLEPTPNSIAVRVLTPGEPDPVSQDLLKRYTHVCTIVASDDDRSLSPEDSRRVVQFLDTHAPTATTVVVHCTMGVSRSRGLVLGYLERIGDPYADGFRRISPLHNRGWARCVRETPIDG